MTPSPHTVTADTTVGQAWLVMQTQNVRHLIITNGRGELVGMVSDTDFARQSVPPPKGERMNDQIGSSRASVSTIMRDARIVIDADDDAEEAVDLMVENGMDALVVIDLEGDIVGIVSYPDVMKCVATGPEAWR